MAAASEVEWSDCVKPLVAASYGSFNKNDLPDLVRSIIKSENDILDHEEQYESFYSSFTALSAHYICANSANITKGTMNSVIHSCKILLQFFLTRLQKYDEHCAISQKQLMVLIKGLCKGYGFLQRTDVITLTAMMKSAKLPPHIKTNPNINQEKTEEDTATKEPKKPRVALSSNLLEQLATPLHDLTPKNKNEGPVEMVDKDGDTTIVHISDPTKGMKALFTAKNVATLQQLNAGDVLIDVCMTLPYLMRYVMRYQDAVKGTCFAMPATVNDAMSTRNSFQSLMNDIGIVWRALSLPILEPLTTNRLKKIATIAMSCLYASITVATCNSILGIASIAQIKGFAAVKDEESENYAISIVEKSLEVFNNVSNAIRSSTRAGGHNLQNFHMLGAWCLLTGLQNILNLTPLNITEKSKDKEPTKSKSVEQCSTASPGTGNTSGIGGSVNKIKEPSSCTTRPTSIKVHQGFGVLCVALASQAVTLLTSLISDVKVEGSVLQDVPPGYQSPAKLEVIGHFSAWQRINKLTSSVHLTNLLFSLFAVTYRKACLLKHPDDDTGSSSDSNTYYEDDFSSSEERSADEDDDSEPILGQLFEETFALDDASNNIANPPAPPNLETLSSGAKSPQKAGSDAPSLVPERGEPHGYINLATDILNFMNEHFLSSDNDYIKNYLRTSFGDSHMASLASVIKDLDRETAKNHSVSLYDDFSVALARFNHNLLATSILPTNLQDVLLVHLGVSPAARDETWPLQVYPRTLSVLAQILLLRQQREKNELKSESCQACVSIWTKLLHTLKISIIHPASNTEDIEDINVEHMQLLLFFFHNLELMQKKCVLLQCAQTIITIAETKIKIYREHSLLYLSRLLLIFEYILFKLYEPPAALIEQVQWNLFTIHASGPEKEKDNVKTSAKFYFPCKEVEDNYRKHVAADDPLASMKPRFYNLMSTDFNYQSAPKLSGLATSFMFNNRDVIQYNQLYESLIELNNVGGQFDYFRKDSDSKLGYLGACAVQYAYIVCRRILLCLPPSVKFLENLAAGETNLDHEHLQHALIWAPRIGHKAFGEWIRDYLEKQGLNTQKSECLVQSICKNSNNVKFDIKLAKEYISKELNKIPRVNPGEILAADLLPTLSDIYTLDAVIAKVQVTLDNSFSKSVSDPDTQSIMKVAKDLLPAIFQLIETYTTYIRSNVLHQINVENDSACLSTPKALHAYGHVIGIGSSRVSKMSTLSASIMGLLPAPLSAALEKWTNCTVTDFPAISAWRNAFANDILPSESYISANQLVHMSTLSAHPIYSLNSNLKHMLHALVRFCGDLVIWYPDEKSNHELVQTTFPLILDATTENLADFIILTLERIIGTVETDEFTGLVYYHVVSHCYELIINHSTPESGIDEKILHECLKFMESILDKQPGKKALEKFFTDEADLVSVLLSAANESLSPAYGTKVLKFFNKLFQSAEKNPTDKSLESLCASLTKLSKNEPSVLQSWLNKMISGTAQSIDDGGNMQENRLLLQSLTSYIVKENSHVGEEVANAILKALIPMGQQLLSPASEGIGFAELMVVMATLAGAGSGSGHLALFKAVTGWLEICKNYLVQKDVTEKLEENVANGKHHTMMESASYLLSYVADILSALKQATDRSGMASPPFETEIHTQEPDSDWAEDMAQEDEDSAGEDSDEDSLCNKLCTFTVTQKEFMNQHWYHCHTCKMVDGVGVCTVCAKVCHKDHDVTYAKYGSFFCDCGAKEDGSCLALVKRNSQNIIDANTNNTSGPSPFPLDNILPSSLRRRASSPTPVEKSNEGKKTSEEASKAKQNLLKQIESSKEALLQHVSSSNVINVVMELLQSLMSPIVMNSQRSSPIGSTVRAQKALEDLHHLDKTFDTVDHLMVPTLGSQEGAFENVRMNYNGDQGQTIRQLITAHMVRRVAMCLLSSTHGKRQHLAVSHEKGKITVLQLSALLKQADSSKRKLTLTRLASAPVPFTVLSITGNPCNEDFLAVCGLKDCHVLTFTSSGSVSDHLVLHPQLETGNFIIKALWLPGSQTELAIVTADFVKIYNLSKDALSPQYYFLLPSGKIRDCTFICSEESRSMLLMSSAGYIYTQPMEESSNAKHGPFYVTNILEVDHVDLKDSNGQIAGGGVSIYFSHSLRLLFFSYSQGKSFIGSITNIESELTKLFLITFKSSNGSSSKPNSQPLCQWSEVANHPGLICSITQSSNNPVVMMIKPEAVLVQEIKVLPAKAKITDMVAIRHPSSTTDQQRTTLILLCEDGSLRIYMASSDQTSFWLAPTLQFTGIIPLVKPVRKKKTTKSGRPTGSVSFPVDFFEHCQQMNDVEFGGNDVLQVYNVQQVKHRLNTTGLYIASTKPAGFNIEVTNSDNSMVMVGIRVLVGSQALEKACSYIEMFGRPIPVTLTRNRWYDFSFTREETLTADKKLIIFFGASADPSGVTMIDSIKIYGKTKESFGWPEEPDDFATGTSATVPATTGTHTTDTENLMTVPVLLSPLDRLVASALEVLDGCFSLRPQPEEKDLICQQALDLSVQLLTLPTPPPVQQQTKALLSALHNSRVSYHNHKDQAQLSHVVQCLNKKDLTQPEELDPEAFHQLVFTARSIAAVRPTNLVRFAEGRDRTLIEDSTETTTSVLEVTDIENEDDREDVTPTNSKLSDLDPEESNHFAVQLVDAFWKLHSSRPKKPALAPVCQPGIVHIESTVQALIEIIHAFAACDQENVALAVKLYVKFLLCEDLAVSFACKQALIRVLKPRNRRRRVFIPSPPRCSTPGGADDDGQDSETPEEKPVRPVMGAQVSLDRRESDIQYEVVPLTVLDPSDTGDVSNGNALEALLSGQGGFPPMLDIPPDADDETMVELAIALSLQQPEQSGALTLQGLSMNPQIQSGSSLETGHYSDTTASAGASDDEGSTAATDGSTLRTSPAEHGGSAAGSESGGSAVDSVTGEHNVSGRSSAYGDTVPESNTTGARSETSSVGMPSTSMQPEGEGSEAETDLDTSYKLHNLRLQMLKKLIQYLPEVKEVGGVRAIPFMQVLLMLSSDLDGDEEKDRASLDSLLSATITELNMNMKDVSDIAIRTTQHEVQLISMRLFSVMMSRTKAGTKQANETSSFISNATASALLSASAIDHCLVILKILLDYWKQTQMDEDGAVVAGNLLKPHPAYPPPDMSPFFLRQYVKGHASDVFEAYPQLLTEMVLRLPYQIKKIADAVSTVPTPVFDQAWFYYLCEYMMTQQTPFVRRQVRKLLLFICGSKDKYRQLRDLHALESHMKDVKVLCAQGGFDFQSKSCAIITLPYDTLIALIEHLKACSEIATSRTQNWQRFCQKDESILSFLIQVSFLLEEGVSPILLQLLQSALCGVKGFQTTQAPSTGTSQSSGSPAKHKKDKDDLDDPQKYEEALCISLVQQVNKFVDRSMLSRFMHTFLLESNSSMVRWQAHSLIFNIYRNSTRTQQEVLLDLMWKIWPELPSYGRKAAQFVDLLGYFSLKTQQCDKKVNDYVEKAVSILHIQNQLLANHPNASIYNSLSGLVDSDGYYLESDPCLVCNNPEVPFTNIKLSAIKVDSRFTTTTQIVKLVGSHTIGKITLRIGDLKRTKMVRTINIFYNNRSVQAVVELKNKPAMWHKAKKCTLSAGQTELKIEFPLPIVACNLLLEYADFYENIQASSETLQCPRCSASVPANPGVCANCGENVFQCHKCRAINYDEKDPFLCNACGFCKYAKFDYTLTAKPCCAVDPIENEEDRKKAITSINSLLEKADRAYKQLMGHRLALDGLLTHINEHSTDRDDTTGTSSGSNVNKAIQQLAQRYCGDCKASFDELSKIIQKVLASRKELVEYDRQQKEASKSSTPSPSTPSTPSLELMKALPVASPGSTGKQGWAGHVGRCYGCASAATEHCITLLRAIASNPKTRQILCSQGLIKELVDYNLRRGLVQNRNDVRQLLCLLTKDNEQATTELNSILMDRITTAINNNISSPDLASAVRHEMLLLANSVQREEKCWEQRLRCVLNLFLLGVNAKSPVVMESITLPCLKILQHVIRPEAALSKKNKNKSIESMSSVKAGGIDVRVDFKKWLAGDSMHSYQSWKQRTPSKGPEMANKKNKKEVRARYLMEKYGNKWREKTKKDLLHLKLSDDTWLRRVLFSPSSRAARQVACSMIEALCQVPSRKRNMLDMLTSYLDELGRTGECTAEFLSLYQKLMKSAHWKYYLAVQGVLPHIGNLITKEIEHLTILEEMTLNSDLTQGYALKMLAELLASFIEQDSIKQHYKSKLVGTVLNGYLALRKLVIQRTKLIDETQDKLLELLEEMTTGTESETRAFMAVCVETVKRYELEDLRTPVFIFERLCSIIYPEENDIGEFFMTLEKDSQQEDFLQGRMLGNPYSSNEPGLGPLMRDVKNKICQDCELVALLEDDNGMELLVNNKIISLDLPVKDVYKKVWCSENEGEAMRIVYRMRGLLGDATEEFIETLDANSDEEVDNEEAYKMATVMAECDGLEVMLSRLTAIVDLTRGRPLLTVLLKLFSFCVKVKVNRQKLIQPDLNAINIMLSTLSMALMSEQSVAAGSGNPTIAEQLLTIMETILVEASAEPPEKYQLFAKVCGDKKQLTMLLNRINSPFVRNNQNVLQSLMRIVPFLTFGDTEKMQTLVDYFKPYTNFNKFDFEHTADDDTHLDCFCVISNGIERNANGNQLKDLIVANGIVKEAVEYIQMHAPPTSAALFSSESEEWKEFLSKPALKYILRLLTGLSHGHEKTQMLVSADCIPIFHRLEQVSSDEHVGSLAENLMEALRENESVAKKIEDVRKLTRAEKKKLAMAMREKQIAALGMETNEKGQVTAKSAILKQMEDIVEETGLTCCVCREGYKFQPTKVLGIYTYTKRANIEEFETKSRKTQGYTTVTHFNIIHVDCHMAAVRSLARGRDEWESAALQNANTKCNGLLPLWGPQVLESAFATCLAKHNTYLQECTNPRDIGYSFTMHDLKLLLLRYAQEKSFSDESGGGGRESNMHLIPYLVHMALYVLNTTRSAAREEKNLSNFFGTNPEKWVESSYEAEGPLYWTIMALLVYPHSKWQQTRLMFLKRLLVLAQARHVSPGGATMLVDRSVKEYDVYKYVLVFFALVDGIYKTFFKKVTLGNDGKWPLVLADYVRHNDQHFLEASDKLLSIYQEEVLPSTSFEEFCDVVGLLGEIPNPDSFVEVFSSLPA